MCVCLLSVCVCVCVLCLSVCVCFLSVCLVPVCVSVCLSVCVCLSLCASVSLWCLPVVCVCISVFVYVCVHLCLLPDVFVGLYLPASVCLFRFDFCLWQPVPCTFFLSYICFESNISSLLSPFSIISFLFITSSLFCSSTESGSIRSQLFFYVLLLITQE